MQRKTKPTDLALAFLSGGVLTFMILANGRMAFHTTALFSSLAAHGTGAIAALVVLALFMRRTPGPAAARPPLWVYLGGLSGALTVMLSSAAVNTALALSGTLALGLLGQVVFGLVADKFGLFGLPARRLVRADALAFALIIAGSLLIILFGRGPS